jgi:hypothetical protein
VAQPGGGRVAVPRHEVDERRAEHGGRQNAGQDVAGQLIRVLAVDRQADADVAVLAGDRRDLADDHALGLHVRAGRERAAGVVDDRRHLDAAGEHALSVGQHERAENGADHDGDDRAPHQHARRADRRVDHRGQDHRLHPEILTPALPPQNSSVITMSRTMIATIVARIARPVASPTPCAPPVAVNPYQQWIIVRVNAKAMIFTTDNAMSPPFTNVVK